MRLKNMSKKKKIIAGALMSVLLMGSCVAVWSLSMSSSGIYTITSEGGEIYITKELSGGSYNATNEQVEFSDTILIENAGSVEKMFNPTFTEVRIDNENDTCTDFENDVTFTYKYQDKVLNEWWDISNVNGQIKLAPNEITQIDISGIAVSRSCPQSVNLEIVLTPAQ